MKKILVVSANEKITETVRTGCAAFIDDFELIIKTDKAEAISFINFELPELKILDYTSPDCDAGAILQAIHDDPWLHYGGVMAVCADRATVKKIEACKDHNLLSIHTVDSFSLHFGRMLRILGQNRQFLIMRGLQDTLSGEENGSFVCGTDPFDFSFYTMFLTNYLFNTNRINEEQRMNLQIALSELLSNALEHGNLNISHQEKMEWLETHDDTSGLIAQRAAEPQYTAKQITLLYNIGKEKSVFSISDEGNGFVWHEYISDTVPGRGLDIVRTLVTDLAYNERGNRVTFSIKNQVNASNTVPSIMSNLHREEFKDRQIVCHQNEPTNDLFFIVSGRYAVYSNRKLVSVLTNAHQNS